MKIAVLGAGAMGQVVVMDLVRSERVREVVVGERDPERLRLFLSQIGSSVSGNSAKITGRAIDVTDLESLSSFLEGSQAVVNCIQYTLNLEVMKGSLAARVPYLDLGGLYHMTRKQLALHEQFREAGILALLGCGSTPGITNVMARYAADELEALSSIHIRIGAKDCTESDHPFVPPYSLQTILDEFTENPVAFEDGVIKEVPPLSGEEIVSFPPPIGQMTVFHTLHSELATFPESFGAKGIREASFKIAFPGGFLEKVRFLVGTGLASETPVRVRGASVAPRDLLVALLSTPPPSPSPQENSGGVSRQNTGQPPTPDDLDLIRVEVTGTCRTDAFHSQPCILILEALVRASKAWGVSASALDTGVPASIMAIMIAAGEIQGKGVFPPELIVPPLPFFEELHKRGIDVYSQLRLPLFTRKETESPLHDLAGTKRNPVQNKKP